jgi:hypothetical protein
VIILSVLFSPASVFMVGAGISALVLIFNLLYILVSNIATFLSRSSGSNNVEGGEGEAN